MRKSPVAAEPPSKVTQEELDNLLRINNLISNNESQEKSLLDEIHEAILDSARLSLKEWKNLRIRLKEIEMLIPHIDLIINLKEKKRQSFVRKNL